MPSIRQATAQDIPGLLELQVACYPFLSTMTLWRAAHLEAHQRNFPEGQMVADDEGQLVGHSCSFRVASAIALQPHTFKGITASGTFDAHDPEGDALYGAEIMVHPDYRRRGIGKRLYEARFALMRRLGIRRFVAGGRLPGYERYASIMDAPEYVRQVRLGRLTDRVLTPQLRSGLQVRGVLPGYLPDPKSHNNASLLFLQLPATAGEATASRPRTRKRKKSPPR